MAAALAWTADRGHYGWANAALFMVWLATMFALGATNHPIGPINSLLVPVVIWNLISFRRIADTRLWFLHSAPYATWLGLTTLFWGISAQQGTSAGGTPPTNWQIALEYLAPPLNPAWLLAAAVLGVKEARV